MPSVLQRYSVARNTSNLKIDCRTTQAASDVLAAAGMAAQDNEAALMLWGVNFQGKTSQKLALCEILEKKLAGHMARNRLKGDCRKIVREVLAWQLHGSCDPCSGRGYEVANGTPSLSGHACRVCQGAGKLPLPHEPAYTWLADELSKMTASAAGRIMQKMAVDMSL